MVTLRVGFSGFVAGGRAACGCGNAVSDGDLLGPDEDVFNQQPQHSLAVFDSRGSGAGAQPGEEAFVVVGEFEVGVPGVDGLGAEGVELAAQLRVAGAQVSACGCAARRW